MRKYLRSDIVEPEFNVADRASKLDPHADKLSRMLLQEAGRSRKEKRTVKQLHVDLVALGYEGSYNRVAAFAREWKAARQREQQICGRGAFVPLAFIRARLSSSTGQKTGRSSMASGQAEFCNPASGWEKGQIEKNVQDARHRLWQPMPNFPSLAALNDWLEARCRELWAQTPHGSQPGAIADVWLEEAQHLMRLVRPFDGFVEYGKRVSPTCLIYLERNRYSVPASFANRPVSVRVYPERIVVVAEGQIVCEHRRVFARSHERESTTTVYDWRHYLAVVQRKPGALRNGAPFAELPPAFRALQQRMLKTPGGDREMVEIWPWSSSMTNRPCSPPSNWRWKPARRPRHIF